MKTKKTTIKNSNRTNKIFLYSMSLIFILFMIGCDNDPNTTLATISTVPSSAQTYTSIEIGGDITSDGGTNITQRGICWSENPNPTVNDNVISAQTDTYTVTIENLSENSTYYVRAFAVNSDGVSYGNEEVVNTWTISNTQWAFLLNYLQSNPPLLNYPGNVDFYSDGTAKWDEPAYPGQYTQYGTWTVGHDTLYYNFLGDPQATSYVFTGIVTNADTMSGTFTWDTNPPNTFTATKY